MKLYQFSGHLYPRPPGTETAMCALSGCVYLETDVKRELHEREIVHERDLARCESKIAKLTDQVARLKKRLQSGKSGEPK